LSSERRNLIFLRVRPYMWAVFTTAMVVPLAWLGITGTSAGTHGLTGGRVTTTGFSAFGNHSPAISTHATSVYPVTMKLAGGGMKMIYRLPDGEIISIPSPPHGFNPLRASKAELAEYDFPPRPSDPADLKHWTAAMAAYKSDAPPSGALQIVQGTNSRIGSTTPSPATSYSNWGGYIAGKMNTQSNTYVAVTTDFSVPSTANTCNGSNLVGMWIGLGGTYASHTNNLVSKASSVVTQPSAQVAPSGHLQSSPIQRTPWCSAPKSRGPSQPGTISIRI
jgi:hypothetical protein